MTRGRWVRGILIGGLAALVLGRWLAVTATDRMWAGSLGVAADHAAISRLQTTLFLSALGIASAWTLGNLALVYRSIGSVHVPRRLANIEIVEALPRRFLLMTFVGIGLALALAVSFRAGSWWSVRALVGYGAPVGTIEPILGRDIGYYLFQLPWQRTMHGFALTLAVVMFGVITIGYVAIGAFSAQDRGLRVNDHARRHLGGLLVVVALVLLWGYRLEAPEGVAGFHGVPFDTILIDVRLPTGRLLSALALLAILTSVIWIRYDRFSIVAFGWITLATFSVVGHYLIPAVAGGSRTADERVPAEFVEARTRFEQIAYGPAATVDTMPRDGPEGRGPVHVPVWYEFAVRVIAGRVLGPDTMPSGVDLGLTVRDGHPEWVVVNRIDGSDGGGVLVLPADTVGEDGGPVLPDQSLPGARLPVRFGPGRRSVVLETAPDVVGVEPRSVLDRLALAWRLQQWSLLTAPAEDRVVFPRDARERLERYAPFAEFDGPVPARVDGRIVWLANGYAMTDGFPLSRPVEWQGRAVGYLRAGLAGVVDGHSGATRVFLRPEADPISVAWKDIAPEIVEPFSALPGALAEQFSYPAAQFEAWLELVSQRPPASRLPFFRRGRNTLDDTPLAPALTVDAAPGDRQMALRRRAVVETPEGAVLLEGSVSRGQPVLREFPLQPDVAEIGSAARRLAEASGPGVGSAVSLIWTGQDWAAVQAVYTTSGPDSLPSLAELAADVGEGVGRGPTLRDALARAGELSEPDLEVRGDWAAARLWFERLDRARRRGDWVSFGLSYEALRRLFGVPPDSLP